MIDADSLLEPNALTPAVLPFLESPDTLAVGGIIRVVNGCKVEAGRVTEVRVPGNWIARFRVVEYLRAFLAGRVAHSAMGALLIISGAFGLFRRQDVVEAGGLDHRTIAEDMELCVRLHRRFRERRQPYRMVFLPDAVCWTEVPESRRILGNQRNRWQRGLFQVLGHHRTMISYRRYTRIRDLLHLIGLGIAENFGSRQLTTWWRLKGTYDVLGAKAAGAR